MAIPDWKGGGGTDFRPVFERLAAADRMPAALLYMTDAEGRFPERAPVHPVLWLLPEAAAPRTIPFGEVLVIGEPGGG